jgi:Putative metallopeptidase domain
MKTILNWGEFSKYNDFVKTGSPILENAGEDLVKKRVKIKVDYAIRKMAGRYKFFAELVYNLRIIYTYRVQTAAVDGTNMFINPNFFDPLTENQILFIVAHEVMHCALLHFARMQGRDGFRWNVAGDYEINLLLADDGIISQSEIKNELHGLIDDSDLKMPDQPEENDGEEDGDTESDSTKGGEGNGPATPPKGKEVLKPGNIIYDKVNDVYGVVNSIDSASGEVDFEPLTKEQAEKALKDLK